LRKGNNPRRFLTHENANNEETKKISKRKVHVNTGRMRERFPLLRTNQPNETPKEKGGRVTGFFKFSEVPGILAYIRALP
jgi:hypothetical protein